MHRPLRGTIGGVEGAGRGRANLWDRDQRGLSSEVPTYVYNPPPTWPQPPPGWAPSPGWQPDPAWGPPPPGWQLWVLAADPGARWGVGTVSRATVAPPARRRRSYLVAGAVAAIVLLAAAATASFGTSTEPRAGGSRPTAPSTAVTPTSATPTPTPSTPSASPSPSPRTSAATVAAAPGSALRVLATLAVKGRAPKTGYDRGLFGSGWIDTDRNGCDTRDDMLRRDLRALTIKPGTYGCVVLAGTLSDPYSATSIRFVRGGADEVDVDHVVALSDAWQKGAQQWPAAKRIAFANDPMDLQSTDYSLNRQKGDADAASWLPPNKAYRCTYVARQVGVKAKYGLWVTAAEHDAIARVLAACPSTPAPSGGLPTLSPVGRVGATSSAPRPVTSPTARATAGLDPRFGTCAAAKAAGYGPYYRGRDPEYSWYVDRDHDGIVCE